MGTIALESFLEVALGTRKIELTLNEINYLTRSGPTEMAQMGLGTPFNALKPHHLDALRRATAAAAEQRSQSNARTTVRIDL